MVVGVGGMFDLALSLAPFKLTLRSLCPLL